MLEIYSGSHKETIERYCHIIGENTTVSKCTSGGNIQYECMNKHLCEKNGGCKNNKYAGN